jgi:hypothetical protein
MRIYEILNWNNDPAEEVRPHPHPHLPTIQFNNGLGNLASAFTRGGLVKHHWNLCGSEEQPSGPAPPHAGTDLIPSSALQPTTASWQAEPAEIEHPVGQQRLVGFRRPE